MTGAAHSVVEIAFEVVPTPIVVLGEQDGGWLVESANRAAVRRFGEAVRPHCLPWAATPEHDPTGIQLACSDLASGRAATCLLEVETAGTAPTVLELLLLETDRPMVLVRAVECHLHVDPACLVARVDHELRTPLSSIVGYSELLLSGSAGALDDQQVRMIRRISGNAWHLVDRIEAMSTQRTDAG